MQAENLQQLLRIAFCKRDIPNTTVDTKFLFDNKLYLVHRQDFVL